MISDFLKPALTLLPQMRKDLDDLGLSAVQAAKVEPPKLFTASGVAQIKLTDEELGNVTETLNAQRKALDEAAEKPSATPTPWRSPRPAERQRRDPSGA
jgi:hypothetical protein